MERWGLTFLERMQAELRVSLQGGELGAEPAWKFSVPVILRLPSCVISGSKPWLIRRQGLQGKVASQSNGLFQRVGREVVVEFNSAII